MALDFPNSPNIGDYYNYPPYQYVWDGEKWKTVGRGTDSVTSSIAEHNVNVQAHPDIRALINNVVLSLDETSTQTAALTNVSKLLTGSGYLALPWGLTVQWGKVTPANGDQVFIFPTPFNECFSIVGSLSGDVGYHKINVVSPSEYRVVTKSFPNQLAPIEVNWIAVGT